MTESRVPRDRSSETPSSLLVRIREKDPEAWQRFVRLYSPLIYHWCRKCSLSEEDSADVGQEVFTAVSQSMDKFRHDQQGSTFRGWLRRITTNKINDLFRHQPLGGDAVGGEEAFTRLLTVPIQTPPPSDDEREKEELLLLRQAIEMVLSEFKEETRRAFLMLVVDQRTPADIAEELGISINSVYLAKSRVRHRLRQDFQGMIESV